MSLFIYLGACVLLLKKLMDLCLGAGVACSFIMSYRTNLYSACIGIRKHEGYLL